MDEDGRQSAAAYEESARQITALWSGVFLPLPAPKNRMNRLSEALASLL